MSFSSRKTLPKKFRKKLRNRCLQTKRRFCDEGTPVVCDKDDFYIYRKTGSKVLGVAHMDYVSGVGLFAWPDRDRIYSPQLDDRLGCFILLDMLPAYGINVDILLTDNEEICASTAKHFTPEAEYNWIFSFDRRGTDVVLYQYEDQATEKLLEEHGFKVGMGSYSDIADLSSMGVKGFNFGCGYIGQHSNSCYAPYEDIVEMVEKFVDFHGKMKDTKLPHDASKEYGRRSWKYQGYGGYYPTQTRGNYHNYSNDSDYWYRTSEDPRYLDWEQHYQDMDRESERRLQQQEQEENMGALGFSQFDPNDAFVLGRDEEEESALLELEKDMVDQDAIDQDRMIMGLCDELEQSGNVADADLLRNELLGWVLNHGRTRTMEDAELDDRLEDCVDSSIEPGILETMDRSTYDIALANELKRRRDAAIVQDELYGFID